MKRPTIRSIPTILRRTFIVVLAALAAGMWFRPDYVRSLIPRPEVEVFDVGARVTTLSAESPNDKSITDSYYMGTTGSAHLHLIGKGVTCELHLHERTEEACIPVSGRPMVTEIFSGADGPVTRTAEIEVGTLVISRPNGAHAWKNQSESGHQATLVLTLGSVFPGNEFVTRNDPRILKAETPLIFEPRTHKRILDRGLGNHEFTFRVANTSITALSLTEVRSLEPAGAATLLYVVEGSGRFEGGKRPFPLKPTTLVVSRLKHPARIVPNAGASLLLYLAPMI